MSKTKTRPAKSTPPSTPVVSVKHKDKRVNIPTEELRDFVAEDEKQPKTVLYPRDPSLDPQLVWKGKDEQDQADLAVPAVPIYIQEKIHPQVIIENVRGSLWGIAIVTKRFKPFQVMGQTIHQIGIPWHFGWIAPKDGGGFDKDTAKKVALLKVGDKVKIAWTFEEHRRIDSIDKVE